MVSWQKSFVVNYQFQPPISKQMFKPHLIFASATTQSQQHLDSYGKLQMNLSIQKLEWENLEFLESI